MFRFGIPHSYRRSQDNRNCSFQKIFERIYLYFCLYFLANFEKKNGCMVTPHRCPPVLSHPSHPTPNRAKLTSGLLRAFPCHCPQPWREELTCLGWGDASGHLWPNTSKGTSHRLPELCFSCIVWTGSCVSDAWLWHLSPNELNNWQYLFFVVISQTHWLVSQERLSLKVGTSVFIDLPITPSGEQWF